MSSNRLIYLPLGGAGEIGMNAYVYGYGPQDAERLIVVDLGVTFPDMDTTPGVDLILPDITWLKERKEMIAGIFITHAHEDHVGAVAHTYEQLGAPIYAKLDTDLAAAMMSINAVKGVNIGDGLAAGRLTGSANADEIVMGPDGPEYLSNHAGGILGGISTGQDIVVQFAVKPTSSILTPRKTITKSGDATEIVTKGRHDPCVGIRAVPVGEAMAACVILDHLLRDRGQTGGVRGPIG